MKYRYAFCTVPMQAINAQCQAMEDEGWEIHSVTPTLVPMQAQGPLGGAQPTLVPVAASIIARLPRNTPKTKMELDAERQASSKIVTLDGKGPRFHR